MKWIKITGLFVISLFGFIGVAHAFMFPQQSRSICIHAFDFDYEDGLYYRTGMDKVEKEQLLNLIGQAEQRVESFWRSSFAKPNYIYCATKEDYHKFGSPFDTPATVHMKLGSYVVISKDGIDLDVLSHEISHSVLFDKIGFINREMKIPAWFDEGLAMQVDHRKAYSIENLDALTDGFKNLPDVESMHSFSEFFAGDFNQVKLHYSTAKYKIFNWYAPYKLDAFIESIRSNSFEESFN